MSVPLGVVRARVHPGPLVLSSEELVLWFGSVSVAFFSFGKSEAVWPFVEPPVFALCLGAGAALPSEAGSGACGRPRRWDAAEASETRGVARGFSSAEETSSLPGCPCHKLPVDSAVDPVRTCESPGEDADCGAVGDCGQTPGPPRSRGSAVCSAGPAAARGALLPCGAGAMGGGH